MSINTNKLTGDYVGTGIMNKLANLFHAPLSSLPFDYMSKENERQRIEQAQRLYDFYHGNLSEICDYIGKALSVTFSSNDIAQFQMLYLPVMNRIIKKICMVYKGDVQRQLSSEKQTELLLDTLALSDIDAKSRYWYEMGKVFHTVLVQPVVRTAKDNTKFINFEVWTPNKITVKEQSDNYLLPAEVMYDVIINDEVRTIHWSDQVYEILDEHGNRIPDETNPKGINPYGVLPFIVLRLKETENFWGEGETILANVEEKVDVLLVQLMDILIMQGHGQPVFENASVDGDVKTGPKYPLVLKPVYPDRAASFGFVQSNGKVKEIQEAIDWLITRTMTMYGISQSASQEASQVASGYAKLIDNWDVIEQRQEDVRLLKDFEARLFDLLKVMLKYEGMATFAESEELSVDFGDYQFPEDPMVEINVKKEKLKLGLWTPVDDLMAEDPTLTKDDAIQILAENLTIRNQLNDEFGIWNQPASGAENAVTTQEEEPATTSLNKETEEPPV